MLNEFIQTQSTIVTRTGFLFGEEADTPKHFWQRTEVSFKSGNVIEIRVKGITSSSGEEEWTEISEPSSTQQRLAFPSCDEEDILNWDVATVAPPPRQSGTIRVKLIYKGRSKPIPVDDPWE